ncbi:MAG: 16S rRNA (cytidine(1402)-2'-O)-methyltransferase [Gammaproteobacteria bacterium]|nr:16S rRNA (cytidine(1402)-2'-O)-methyltransferase [Gammaproteobacteria bacterium]MCW8923105.1 16S rRNA (cytidine(1402)-2'-O)-methyltransferase [Gammaproteobacteria bacterium]
MVATPIGNLDDISPRAVETLRAVDLIAAEDTRHSQRLLNHLGVETRMQAYHEHNEEVQAERLIARLQQGESIALISDAGTPLVSDPGYRLLEQAHFQSIKVVPIPGACAAIAAMSVAGLPSDRFSFEGFPPAKQTARLSYLQALKDEPRTMVFYISCHRILETLQDMKVVFGEQRLATFAREVTKTYETIRKATLDELSAWVTDDEMQRKGEIVLVVAGSTRNKSDHPMRDEILAALVDELPVKQAAKITSRITGINKNELYEAALELKKKID